jgi:hypothetical protein
LTSTGVLLFVVVPLPSSPFALLPQHFTPPDVVTAHA